MTVQEAARRIGVSERCAYQLCAARRIGHARVGVGKGRIVISEADVAAYLAANRVEPAGQGPTPARRPPVPDRCGELAARRAAARRA